MLEFPLSLANSGNYNITEERPDTASGSTTTTSVDRIKGARSGWRSGPMAHAHIVRVVIDVELLLLRDP